MMILQEQIYYNVAGIADALNKLRQFAIAQGWTIDYWQPGSAWNTIAPYGWISGSETNLQMFSEGYGNQGMVHRIRSKTTSDPSAGQIYNVINKTPDRHHAIITTHPISQDAYRPPAAYTEVQSTPTSAFDSMYLYGNEKFISMTLKVTSMSVITYTFGTIDLFKSWESYFEGLWFLWSAGSGYLSDSNKWYNIDSNPSNWYMPGASTSYRVFYEGATNTMLSNYQPTSVVIVGEEVGSFNRMIDFLWFNTFTNKRVAFHPTIFLRDPTSGTFFVCGKLPFAYINGTNLTFGQTVNFGTDTYKCYPGINIPNPIWVAYRIA